MAKRPTKKAGKQRTTAKRRRGRPSKYRAEFAEQAMKLCLLGATDIEIADFFGVQESTLNNWKSRHPDFLESITRGKTIADATVAEKLFHRACGYEHPEDKIFQYEGQPLIVPTIKHYPPDTPAASLWLRNRQPEKWRDKQTHEHTGKDGGPIEHKDLTNMPEDEIDRQLSAAGIDPKTLVLSGGKQ